MTIQRRDRLLSLRPVHCHQKRVGMHAKKVKIPTIKREKVYDDPTIEKNSLMLQQIERLVGRGMHAGNQKLYKYYLD